MMWHRLNVLPSELRVYDTLLNGQAFGWRQLGRQFDTKLKLESAIAESKSRKRKRAINGAAVNEDTQTEASKLPAETVKSYELELVGVIGDVVVGLKESVSDTYFRCHNKPTMDPEHMRILLHDYFQLSVNLGSLYKQWSDADSYLQKISKCIPGIRAIRQDPVECTFSFLCSSNNNISRISQMLERFRSKYGTYLCHVNGVAMYEFPSVERIARINESELRDMGFGYRAPFITKSANKILDNGGASWLLEMRKSDLDKTREDLLMLHGVGRKVADCIALFSLDKACVVPVDTHVWHIASREFDKSLLHESKSLTPKMHDRVMKLFTDRFGEYAGWAHSLMFAAELPRFADRIPAELAVLMKEFRQEEEEIKKALKAKGRAKSISPIKQVKNRKK